MNQGNQYWTFHPPPPSHTLHGEWELGARNENGHKSAPVHGAAARGWPSPINYACLCLTQPVLTPIVARSFSFPNSAYIDPLEITMVSSLNASMSKSEPATLPFPLFLFQTLLSSFPSKRLPFCFKNPSTVAYQFICRQSGKKSHGLILMNNFN